MSFKNNPDYEMYMLQETYEKKIEELKQEIKIIKDKYDLLVIMTTDTKKKKKKKQKVVMTPEQEEICEMFRMDL